MNAVFEKKSTLCRILGASSGTASTTCVDEADSEEPVP